jgi:N-acyl homoserine lactone hydrolase
VSSWSIWVLEYSRIVDMPLSALVTGKHGPETRVLPFSYIYLRGHGHHVLVDIGYDDRAYAGELAASAGAVNWAPPAVVLAEVGIRPEDIDIVFVTHAHFDHFGNTGAFPNARFYLQERELMSWVWAMALPHEQQFITDSVDPDDVLRAVALAKAGRLELVDGDKADVLPGINLWAAHDTHTFGSMFLDVQAGDDETSRYVLSGDAVYVYENVDGLDDDGMIRPVGLTLDRLQGIRSIAQMKAMVPRTQQIIPMHEARLAEVFPSRTSARDLWVTAVHVQPGEESYV